MVSNHGIANIHSIRSPDSTHASASFGISSVRRRFVHDMLPNFTRHLSPMPRLHFVTLGIGCPSPSVVSRIRLRLRGTLPHPRILLSFFPCIIDASRPPNKETPYLFHSRNHKAAAAAARRRRERLVAVCVVCVLSSCVRDRTSFIRAHALSLFEPLGSHSCLSYIL